MYYDDLLDKRKPRTELKAVLMEQGISQKQCAMAVGFSEPVFSMLIRGSYWPTKFEIYKIASYLQRRPEELFPGLLKVYTFEDFDNYSEKTHRPPMRRGA